VALWFLGRDENVPATEDMLGRSPHGSPGLPAVLISPNRSRPWEALLLFGRSLDETMRVEDHVIHAIRSSALVDPMDLTFADPDGVTIDELWQAPCWPAGRR
jgi:hypothetical protein